MARTLSTEKTRRQAKNLYINVFNDKDIRQELAHLPEGELDRILAPLRAARWAGLDCFPQTCSETRQTLEEGLAQNGVLDFYRNQSYIVQGLALLAAKLGYDHGVADGRAKKDN